MSKLAHYATWNKFMPLDVTMSLHGGGVPVRAAAGLQLLDRRRLRPRPARPPRSWTNTSHSAENVVIMKILTSTPYIHVSAVMAHNQISDVSDVRVRVCACEYIEILFNTAARSKETCSRTGWKEVSFYGYHCTTMYSYEWIWMEGIPIASGKWSNDQTTMIKACRRGGGTNGSVARCRMPHVCFLFSLAFLLSWDPASRVLSASCY